MLAKILVIIMSVSSFLSIIFIDVVPQWVKYLIVFVSILILVYLIVDELRKWRFERNKYIICHSPNEIQNRMYQIIKNAEGHVCIFSGRMSWTNSDIIELMKEYKERIRVYAEKANQITMRLEKIGIQVKYYGKNGYRAVQRFTIINRGRPNTQLAIAVKKVNLRGRKTEFIHTIYITGTNDKTTKEDAWLISMANDIINMCDKI